MVGLNHELSRELLWREFPAVARRDAVPPVLGRPRPARRARGAARHPADLGVGRHAAGRAPARRRRPARAARARRAAAPLPDDDDLRRARDGRPARSTPRRGWRRCSAARSRRTSCSSASRSARRPRWASIRPGPAGTSSSRSTRASRASGSTSVAATDASRNADALAWAHVPLTPSGHADVLQPLLRRRQAAGELGTRRGRHGFAHVPAAVPGRDARVAADSRGAAAMTDLAAIAAARVAAQAAEADALALADRLVAAKADRRRLRADLAQLPGALGAHAAGARRRAGARDRRARRRATAAASRLADAAGASRRPPRTQASSRRRSAERARRSCWPSCMSDRRDLAAVAPAAQLAQLRAAITRLRHAAAAGSTRATAAARAVAAAAAQERTHGRRAHRGAERECRRSPPASPRCGPRSTTRTGDAPRSRRCPAS